MPGSIYFLCNTYETLCVLFPPGALEALLNDNSFQYFWNELTDVTSLSPTN